MARGVLAIVMSMVITGCGGAPGPTQAPTPTSGGQPTGQSTSSPAANPTDGIPSATPTRTAAATQGANETPGPTDEEPLPEPTLTDPADIAAALFDSELVPDGVVSLVDAMGVAIYDDAGTLVRPGSDTGAGPLTLTENEVRGLIEMTLDDVRLQDESGGPLPFADIYAALQPSLPDGFTLEQLAAGYNDAYAEDPGSLAAQVMRGRRLDAEAGVLRIQMWLLLIDGFVGPPEGGALPAAHTAGGGIAHLPPGQTLGAAATNLPGLAAPAGWTPAEWAEALYRLPTLASTVVVYTSGPSPIHEGHGAPGSPVDFLTAVSAAGPIVSQFTGRTIIQPANRPGVSLMWTSPSEPTWNAHGAFDQSLGQPVSVDPGGASRIHFTPKKEDANGAGTKLNESATLYTTVDQLDLVIHAYDLGGSLAAAAAGLISGTKKSSGPRGYSLEWHEIGDGYWVDITWTDVYAGIADTITIRGTATTKVDGVPGINFTGIGTASGDRSGWASCNPGIDFLPTGPAPAEIDVGVQGNEIVFSAYPTIGTGLAGIYTGPFILPAEGGEAEQFLVQVPSGDLCPHSIAWKAKAVKLGHP